MEERLASADSRRCRAGWVHVRQKQINAWWDGTVVLRLSGGPRSAIDEQSRTTLPRKLPTLVMQEDAAGASFGVDPPQINLQGIGAVSIVISGQHQLVRMRLASEPPALVRHPAT